MPVTIRQATLDDAGKVAAVINTVIAEGWYTLFDTPFSEAAERAFLASLDDRSAVFVAEEAGEILGVQSIDRFARYADSVAHIAHVGTWLLPKSRGQGIGRALAAASFAFAQAKGYSKIVISVLAHNDRALRFYRGLGFVDIGIARRHVRLHGTLHDEVFLEKLF